MSSVLSQPAKAARQRTLAPGFQPVALHFVSGKHATVEFANGKHAEAVCLRCPDTPCATFGEDETRVSNFDRFPADRIPSACAASAITVSVGGGPPVIEAEACMFCGVCATRCPVGAIALVPGKGAMINDAPNAAFIETDSTSAERHAATVASFQMASANGAMLDESDDVLKDVFSRLYTAWNRVGDRYPNMLSRNLFIGAGVGAAMGRKGNNFMRMDLLLGPPSVEHGVAEVEYGHDAVLDGPRDTLDAMAVLISRYSWVRDKFVALVVSDVLPNRRSEYWSIVQDIRNVLHIDVGTVTVLALMLMNWNRRQLDFTKGHCFYADRNTRSYRDEVLEPLIKRKLNLGMKPCPQVDIAK